jgi:hypothetical protein
MPLIESVCQQSKKKFSLRIKKRLLRAALERGKEGGSFFREGDAR